MRRWTRPPLPAVSAVAIPLSLAVAPYVWSYGRSALLVSGAVFIGAMATRRARVRVVALALLALVVVALPWAFYWTAFRRGDEAWSVAVPIAMLVVVAFTVRSGPGAWAGASAWPAWHDAAMTDERRRVPLAPPRAVA